MWNHVDELLKEAISQELIPGCAFASGRQDTVLHHFTPGKLSESSPEFVDEHTLYDMGALTRVMATMPLALIALERGLISLDDTIDRYLDFVPSDKADMTILQLLTHTAGMPPRFHLHDTGSAVHSPAEALLQHPLAAPVGKQVLDSDMGFLLLGLLLEKVLKLPVDVAFRQLISTPLGMKRTGFLPSGHKIAPSFAQSENWEWSPGQPQDKNARFLHGVAGHAGLFGDLEDMVAFAQMLACNGHTPKGVFLSERALHLATADRTRSMNEAMGYGFRITKRSNPFLGHLWPSGAYGLTDPAGGSLIAVNPEDGFYTVFLVNGRDSSHQREEMERLQKLLLNASLAAYQHGSLAE